MGRPRDEPEQATVPPVVFVRFYPTAARTDLLVVAGEA